MAIREVLKYPHPLLKQAAREVQPDELDLVVTDLIDTMSSFPGCVGIAAPQIGEMVRVAVVDTSNHPKSPDSNGLLVLANPSIVRSSGHEVGREGCLSIPDFTANVGRATDVQLKAEGVEISSTGFEARCIQHELDHLEGILFLDRVSSLTEDIFPRKRYR